MIDVLGKILAPLARHYERPDTEEIAVVGNGGVYRRQRNPKGGPPWIFEADPAITIGYAADAITAVGNATAKPKGPVVYAELQGEGGREHRFTGAFGPNIGNGPRRQTDRIGGAAMTIRQGAPKDRDTKLDDWEITPGTKRFGNPLRGFGRQAESSYEAIYEAAHSGFPMLFAGPTGSGKTTLLNMLLRELDRDLRVLTVQDTAELQVPNGNHTHIYTTRSREEGKADADDEARRWELLPSDVVNLVTRMTPDVIVVGEISTDNAGLAAELRRTGHKNFWTSIHAENPREAGEAFADRIRHGQPDIDHAEETERVLEAFTIIQCNVDATGNRVITGIHQPGAE